jgi:hypothetical protein
MLLSCNLFYELRLSLVKTVLSKPIDFFKKFKTADILSRMMNDLINDSLIIHIFVI